MVSSSAAESQLSEGLSDADSVRLLAALEFVTPHYADLAVVTGQDAMQFVQGVTATLAMLRTDVDTRIAALLFELPQLCPTVALQIEARFGKEIATLVSGIRRLMKLREAALSRPMPSELGRSKDAAEKAAVQMETLRKMVLAMATDMRVVLVRLASRVTTLRYFADCKRDDDETRQYASETMDLYAPLANRLGVWQLKWELEDLSFRFLEPLQYKRIAKMLEEKRVERESFVVNAIARLNRELLAAEVKAEVSGRPKHIYSIWKKMKGKTIDFDELYDVRAFRVIVDDIKDCYTVLGIVHNAWAPIPKEFDDYISRPKANGYKSLHTVVVVEDGRPLEVQIRTREMHQFAEYGVAAHWRYKENGGSNFVAQEYDGKIAWLRQLLAWKSDITDAVVEHEEVQREWVEKLKAASLDDRIYVLTPQARVIELPNQATPVDFAYQLHTDVGHRCRGARVDSVMVPLNTRLQNGQTVEIITLKIGSPQTGPSRDWLNPEYSASTRTRTKIRAWFNAIDQQETLAAGRAQVEKTLQREGKTAVNLEELARKLGFAALDELFLSVGKEEFSLRQIEAAVRDHAAVEEDQELIITNKSRASSVTQGAKSGVLVVGTDGLMTQLARCCKPAPPDGIVGFVTRGKGVSIHRLSCKNFAEMRNKAPERVIQTTWGGGGKDTVYPVDIFVMAQDRQGLLRDISEVFSREKINVIGVNTQSAKGFARMSFTVEIGGTTQLQKALTIIHEVGGVVEVRRQ
ncbi:MULTISPECIES: bifunctional (p)ppGpp synthetase/guanosine-3',5'-bis(diphosphate) 3'-pyrophosphohydrolase [unclassified Undibacterium]|uniref:RelA/SpoT family protein n=1 Tax=unclassified Undibacterium TaxID=2630295 RepID=UPI002AC8FB54|nr:MULTISPECIES: bifunctional (p)ppGpp synthetase/guanosine-3',5'-bis(diphosphate) 3'-pyrophosphohydrolase [unclassified Undibacterium]MEB0139603.1 bifunctional (p)ppGpp synthetase/guanosine-3',5'-bis(diphosphate) 3'-pyrophosphohydrolase [Undibacterium sp. CCC2.1]MEB0171959.1 bifunctional (p)ppGpp synthetase/guanosine-3',5'-bis(diphosphate) 3'-pyrophosphohydrolase [Undibacterium sp. CCC1.1]MEB0176272.1 bifunctional (p)ppGpp synthetase/guanosine-3',5'-bis(diphosphate) 3'-pyrophosphohydrolase [Und